MTKKSSKQETPTEDKKISENINTPTPPKRLKEKCFIVTQIGNDNSEIRRHTDGIINAIRRVLEPHDYEVTASHEDSGIGSISVGLIERILNDKLVIANLTGLNPNVMYELAVRHAVAKPIITIAEKGTELPFDLSHERTIFYSNDISGFFELQDNIKRAFESIDFKKPNTDNPIYRAQAKFNLQKIEKSNAETVLLSQLENINNSISKLNYKYDRIGLENKSLIPFFNAMNEINTNYGEASTYLRSLGFDFDGRNVSHQEYLLLKERFGLKNDKRGNIR